MKVQDVAMRLEVAAGTIYSLIAASKLRCHRVGVGRGVIRISEEQLADYLAASEQKVSPPPDPKPRPARKLNLRHIRLPWRTPLPGGRPRP